MPEEKTTKSYVDDEGSAVIICPDCFRKRTVPVDKFRGKQSTVKVRCSCSHLFHVNLEFRRHYRKNTNLDSKYQIKPPANSGGICEINNLSLSGLSFTVRGIHDIQIGQLGTIEFTLDNRKQTELFKHVIVRNVIGNKIGCEFLDQQAFERELGFYLRS